MIKNLFAYLLIEPDQSIQHDPQSWKASVPRMIALSCLLLVASIVCNTVIEAYREGLYHVIYANLVLYMVLVVTLNTSHTYIQSLLFLFFNVCIPLAVFRVLHTLEQTTAAYQSLNSQTSLSKDLAIVKQAQRSLIEYERKKQYLKHYDPLTRLPNRDRLLLLLKEHIAEAVNTRQLFAVITFRVNYFRYIDQKYGTVVGDTLLSTLAEQMAPLADEYFVLARLRGIVFCLVTRHCRDYHAVRKAVEVLHRRLPASLSVNDVDIPVSYRCGVSVCPVSSSRAEELIRQSEKALDFSRTAFSAKPVFFDTRSNIEKNNQIEMELAIKRALENNDLYTLFQPKLLHDGTLVGAEMLVRMGGRGTEAMVPDLFIPAAERGGLIREIEEWVIVSLCQFIRRSLEAGIRLPPIAVNISSRTIVNTGYADRLIKLITGFGIPSSCIELEITETSLMIGRDNALNNLVKLQKFGFTISIDDFGTGYSSLGQIIDMPVSTLKIDRSFLAGVPQSENHITLVRTIISLGKQLGLKLVAEGVENAEQLAFLRNEGCDMYQGYYFHKPLLGEKLTELIAQQAFRSRAPSRTHSLTIDN